MSIIRQRLEKIAERIVASQQAETQQSKTASAEMLSESDARRARLDQLLKR